VVDLFADAWHELRGALADPRPEAHLNVAVLATDAGDLATALRISDDDEPLTLAEPRGRRPLGEAGDPFDRLAPNAALFEPPDGAPLHHDIHELHSALLRDLAVLPGRGPSGNIRKTPGGPDPWRSMSL
jgi:hypothetical protein